MKKTTKFLIFLTICLALIMPVFSLAAGGLVPCDGVDCDFKAFMTLINKVINFIFVYMALPIAAIMFAFAGFLMVSSGGSTESRTKAKSIFTNAVIGLVLAAAAWLIIKTILVIAGYKDIGTFF